MYENVKRLMDILVALILLALLSPLLAVVMIVLRFTGDGEVFYWQRRIGWHNRYFDICKFATMVKDSMNLGTGSITVRNDPRVTAVGRVLRMTKINELPQLWNVLRGDMSLVGPRPFVDRTFEDYPQHVRDRVYDVKPGLTGIGSIMYRDEEGIISRSSLPPAECYRTVIAPHKGELELWYQRHRNLWLDIKLLCCTLFAVASPQTEWAYQVFRDLPRAPERAER